MSIMGTDAMKALQIQLKDAECQLQKSTSITARAKAALEKAIKVEVKDIKLKTQSWNEYKKQKFEEECRKSIESWKNHRTWNQLKRDTFEKEMNNLSKQYSVQNSTSSPQTKNIYSPNTPMSCKSESSIALQNKTSSPIVSGNLSKRVTSENYSPILKSTPNSSQSSRSIDYGSTKSGSSGYKKPSNQSWDDFKWRNFERQMECHSKRKTNNQNKYQNDSINQSYQSFDSSINSSNEYSPNSSRMTSYSQNITTDYSNISANISNQSMNDNIITENMKMTSLIPSQMINNKLYNMEYNQSQPVTNNVYNDNIISDHLMKNQNIPFTPSARDVNHKNSINQAYHSPMNNQGQSLLEKQFLFYNAQCCEQWYREHINNLKEKITKMEAILSTYAFYDNINTAMYNSRFY